MKIIGITGTIGAGKGAVVSHLVKKGFSHFCARSLLTQELQKRNLELIRDNYFSVGNELRKKYGPAYVIETLLKQAQSSHQNAIVESVRTLGEVEHLQKMGAVLLAVDADVHLRFERIVGRGHSTDNITFEKFLDDEKKESEGTDLSVQNLRACMDHADVVIMNNGSLSELYVQVDNFLSK